MKKTVKAWLILQGDLPFTVVLDKVSLRGWRKRFSIIPYTFTYTIPRRKKK